jgi:hypothetical protein
MRSSFKTLPLTVASACLFGSAFACVAQASAQDFAPIYSRQRMHAHDFDRRGDGHGFSGHRGHGHDNFYYDPYFFSSVIHGSYYQRPYPYHFDYYRHRWGQPHVNYGPEHPPVALDCPCATESYAIPPSYSQPVPGPTNEAAPTPAASDPV